MNTKMLGIFTVALLGTALAASSIAQPRGRGFEGPQPERFIERHDTDGDGDVSEAEFVDERLAQVDRIFERRDTDGDGLISAEEHEAPRARAALPRGPRVALRPGRRERPDRPERPERPEIDREAVIACVRETIADYDPELDRPLDEIFENVDTDGDGMLSLIEVSTALEQRAGNLFARIDDDGDGYITEAEVAAHFEEQLNVRRVVQACIKEQLQD